MKKIKWGIIGPGRIARQFANDFKYADYGELKAVASRSLENASDFANEYSIEKAYGSYDELYNDNDIDAIYIATPHNFHLAQSSDALRAGKAVLCEKPLTVNPHETHELINLAKSTNNYLVEGMWTYFLPAIIKAKEWVEQGRIGNILHVNADFGYPSPFDPESRSYNPKLAGGVLLDMGVYCVAMAWLFQQVEPSKMNVIARKAPTGVDDDVSMLFEYENSAASLTTSFRCKLNNWAYIIGDKGYIAIPDFWRAKECFLYKSDEIIDHFKVARDGFGFNYEIDAVSQDLLQGKMESEIMPHSTTIQFQEIMAKVMGLF